MKGKKSHQLVADALKILVNLDHRGACGCEANTGDGAGILIQVPHDFWQAKPPGWGSRCRPPDNTAWARCSCPKSGGTRGRERRAAGIIAAEGQTVLGWRDVPTDNSSLGKTAVAAEPFMAQVFIGRDAGITDEPAFERKLYIIRKVAEQRIRYGGKVAGGKWFYVSSLSAGRSFTRAC